jgi:hypothetical protein
MEEEFLHKPSVEEIKEVVYAWINGRVGNEILSGFRYNGIPVWLSIENQLNFKAIHDLAIQVPDLLPVKFKLGTDEEPVYYEFNTLTGLTEFYAAAVVHISSAYEKGWADKDGFDFSHYVELLN